MTSLEERNHLVQAAIQGATSNLLAHGRLHPMVMLSGGDHGIMIIPLTPFKSQEDKGLWASIIPTVIRDTRSSAAVMICEAWTRNAENMEINGEIISITGCSKEGIEAVSIEIARGENGDITLGAPKKLTVAHSRFFEGAFDQAPIVIN